MKVFWLCNVILPQVCEKLNISSGNGGGWMFQLSSILDSKKDIDLVVAAPIGKGSPVECAWGEKSFFYGFSKTELNPCIYDRSVEEQFVNILEKEKPDIVHIFGTEFPHTLAMVNAFNNPDRTVIHIQGLVSEYAKYYEAFLPRKVVKKYTFRDIIRRDNIAEQAKKFAMRGTYEIEALKRINHVMGRTTWDYECSKKINPSVQYHFVQEMMRECFYDGSEWKYEKCEKHRIFMSQGGYPIKGLHIMLEALTEVKKSFPNVNLYVAGNDISQKQKGINRLHESYYSVYIRKLIRQNHLENNVHFTGPLDAEGMKKQLLLCNVFVSASSIENSPNSIGEALLLGVPMISSDVGGVSSIIENGENGLLYDANSVKDLVYHVKTLFENINVRNSLSEGEKKKSLKLYDRNSIIEQLIDAYKTILK